MRFALATAMTAMLALPPSLVGQASPSPGIATSADAEAAPAPIPTGEIPARLAETATLLRGVTEQTSRAAPEADILKSLKGLRTAIGELTSISDRFGADATLEEIESLQAFWRDGLRTLRHWNSTMTARTSDLESKLDDLDRQQQAWRLTIEQGPERALQPRSMSRLRQTAASLATAGNDVRLALNRTLEAQTAITDLQIQVDAVMERLKSAADLRRIGLFAFDEAPIWTAVRHWAEEPSRARRSEEQLSVESQAVLREYLLLLARRLLGQALLFCGIAFALIFMRRKSPSVMDDADPAVRALGVVLRRPFSAALLLALLAGRLGDVGVPQTIWNLAWIVLVIPTLRLIPGLLPLTLRRPFTGVAALYGAELAVFLLHGSWFATRLALLVLAVATAIFLARGAAKLQRDKHSVARIEAITTVIRFSALVAGIAAVCNIVGAVSLSRFLLNGVLRSIYGTVLIWAALLILRGFLRLFLRSKGGPAISPFLGASRTQQQAERVLTAAGIFAFIVLPLDAFALVEPLVNRIKATLSTSISIGAIEFVLGDLVIFIAVVLAAFLISRMIRFFLEVSVYPKVGLQRGIAESLSRILHYGVILCGLLIAFSAAGVELSKFTILAGAFGVGLGFGLQTIVNNFVSGLILLFERPIQVGDNVTVGSVAGMVKDIGIRATTVQTWDGADVVIPNGNLISNDLTNWTLSDALRRADIAVGAAYGSDPEKVMRILSTVARSHPRVMTQNTPTALFVGFGDNALQFILRFWTRVEDFVAVQSELHVQVHRALADAGIKIPLPQRDLHLRSIDHEAAETILKDPLYPLTPGPGPAVADAPTAKGSIL